jgi:hypothetical protein
MAERFTSTGQAGYGQGGGGSGPGWLENYMFAPASGYGYERDESKRRGNMMSTYIDPLNLMQQGSEKYGLSAWDDMFGEGGEILDMNGLLRSLNFGGVTGQKPSDGYVGGGGNRRGAFVTGPGGVPMQVGSGNTHAPNMGGDINYFTDDYMEFRGWDPEKGPPRGAYFGDKATERYIKKTGEDPFLSDQHKWLYEMSSKGKDRGSRYGRERTDTPGVWYDPSNLQYTEQDLAGIDNLDDLNDWAMAQFGVDAQTLGASSPDLLEARQAYRADPSSLWDDGQLSAGSIDGMIPADFNLRASGLLQQMQAQQQIAAAQREQSSLGTFNRQALNNPHLMRSSLGRALAEMLPESMQASDLYGQMTTSQPDYGFGFQQAINPYLQQLQEGQARYGY